MNTDKHRWKCGKAIFPSVRFICVHLCSSVVNILLCFLLLNSHAQAKITIEAPLFEGGAGKAFFLQCARDYEKIRPDVAIDMELDPRIADKVRVRALEGSWFEI